MSRFSIAQCHLLSFFPSLRRRSLASHAALKISDQLMSVECNVSSFVNELNQTLWDFWVILENAANLTSCENFNGQYQSVVYDEFCDNLPRALLGFWVSGVILTVLLLMLVRLSLFVAR